MQHLDEGILHALVDGEVPSADLAPIRAHLESCADCRVRLEEARDTAADALGLVEMIEVPVTGPAEGRSGNRSGRSMGLSGGKAARTFALAASLLLAVGLGYFGRGWVASDAARPAERESAQVADAAPPTPVEAGDRVKAIAPAEDPRATEAGATRSQEAPARQSVVGATRPDSVPTVRLADAADERDPDVGRERRAEEPRRDAGAAPQLESRTAAPTPAAPTAPALQRSLREEASVRGAANAMAKSAATGTVPASLAQAASLVGGRLRMIEGMVPDRLETLGQRVLVIYRMATGELVLEQWRDADTIAVRLRGPIGADSLAGLLRRVK